MAMNVEPAELIAAAATLWRLVQEAHAALPTSWVPAAGADLPSTVASALHSAHAESTVNGVIDIANRAAAHAHHIGAAAVDYTLADDEGSRTIGGRGAATVANPVASGEQFTLRHAPPPPVAGAGTVDSLTFAQQLHAGPGPGPAQAYADSIQQYLKGPHRDAMDGIENLIPIMNSWTPIGTTVAGHLSTFTQQLNDIGSSMGTLAANITDYADAFRTAKTQHPTPQEIIATRKRLLAASRAKDSAALTRALTEFNEQNALSTQTHTTYISEVGKNITELPSTGKNADGTGSTQNGTGGAQNNNMIMQMLPTLLSSLMNSASSLSQHDSTQSDLDDADLGYASDLPELPTLTGGGGGPDGGGPGSAAVPDLASYRMPTAGSQAVLANSGLPRTPVIEALPSRSTGSSPARAGGAPYMPYMPMTPGMGPQSGAGGNDRARVVAWHPDRLMYVDDTPHTDAVIGEKPTIAPTVTPPTPAHANQAPTHTGGSV
ncbi:PE family protein [Nocardia jejuensis]|uniref:PE family protein n=1 Tax=Nocardia jejuensis TaxID=328049 RepID=UPI00082AECB0|nr:PE family protein [Nocardia jejuensis]